MRLVYLIGEPGVGKSTLTALALPELANDFGRLNHIGFEVWNGPIGGQQLYYVGSPRHPGFPGTDRLSMSVAPLFLDWLTAVGPHTDDGIIYAEGDRLGNASTLSAAADLLPTHIIRVVAAPELIAARRAGRGSNQNDIWLRGRITKINNLEAALIDRLPAPGLRYTVLPNDEDPADAAATLRRLILT